MGVGRDARRGVQGRPSSPAPLRRELPPDLPRYPPSPTQRGDAGPCVVWRPWVGAVSWELRRNISQSLTCSDQPAAAEPVPAPLSLVNFPLAAVDSKVPPLEIFSRFRHGLWGGCPCPRGPVHFRPSWTLPLDRIRWRTCEGGPRCQACARLSARGGVEGLAGSRPGRGSPRSLLLPRS